MTSPFGHTAEKQAASLRRQTALRLIERNRKRIFIGPEEVRAAYRAGDGRKSPGAIRASRPVRYRNSVGACGVYLAKLLRVQHDHFEMVQG
jgi:hypothetical protein